MKGAWMVPWLGGGTALLLLAMGPGKTWEARNVASQRLTEAQASRSVAEDCQRAASEANVAAIQARAEARRAPTPEALEQAASATGAEELAYRSAAKVWTDVAAIFDRARDEGAPLDVATDRALRLDRDTAWIGAGQLSGAACDLEALLQESEPPLPEAFGDQVREQLCRAYFHGALLMRKAGGNDEAWRAVSERARQHARVLAEGPSASRPAAVAESYQRNLEVIIDFERRSLEELEATPQPRDCTGNCTHPKLDSWPWSKSGRSKGKQPRRPDARDLGGGAGASDSDEGGW